MSNTLFDPAPPPFTDRAHHEHANRLGMWTFLSTEILFFGGMFAAYAVFRWTVPEAFVLGSRHLEFWIGTTNTAILLTSSLFMALADLAVKEGRSRAAGWLLAVTWLLGLAFLCLKGLEYTHVVLEHHAPGAHFRWEGPHPAQVQIFMFLYFGLTGLHAAHMILGLGALAWVQSLNWRGRLTPSHDAPVAMVGLYWHFVDCVWIFLYPLLYLVR